MNAFFQVFPNANDLASTIDISTMSPDDVRQAVIDVAYDQIRQDVAEIFFD